jgi:hypothetical protein
MDVGIRYGDGHWPDLKSTFLLRDAFFPVCSPALLEGMHPLRGPEDLKHHTLIHDRSMASESAFPISVGWRIGDLSQHEPLSTIRGKPLQARPIEPWTVSEYPTASLKSGCPIGVNSDRLDCNWEA